MLKKTFLTLPMTILDLRKEDSLPCSLLVRISKEDSEVTTPHIEEGDDWEEELHQSAILIESVLRGRASQVLVF